MAKPKKPESDAGGFKPGEFEEVELPGVEALAEAEEFEDVDVVMSSLGTRVSVDKLLPAKEQLAKKLILDVADEAFSAESGTDTHGFENIVAVGISEKTVAGWMTATPCVTVFVAAKVPLDEVSPGARVPKEVGGFPTDVVEIGEVSAFPFKGRYRPAPGGVSVGHFKITAGTISCLVKKGNGLFILSNNHVLANVNKGAIGDPVTQPGPFDGGKVPADVIAKLSAFVPIKFPGPNFVDCAIAQTSPSLVSPLDKAYGKIKLPVVPAVLNMLVKKCGRTTQFTRGRVTAVAATVNVSYGTAGVATFQNQIIIQSLNANPFSAGGDSGSLIVTDVTQQPTGLLFAGSTTHTIANPIQAVLAALGVTIVT